MENKNYDLTTQEEILFIKSPRNSKELLSRIVESTAGNYFLPLTQYNSNIK